VNFPIIVNHYFTNIKNFICFNKPSKFTPNIPKILLTKEMLIIMDKNAKYEIAIAGRRYPTEVRLYTPKTAYTTSDPVFIPVPK
jgi:hypothetical protein